MAETTLGEIEMITLINNKAKYHYNTLEEAAKAARTQPQVQAVLDQGMEELRKVRGVYTWSLVNTWRNTGKRTTDFFIFKLVTEKTSGMKRKNTEHPVKHYDAF